MKRIISHVKKHYFFTQNDVLYLILDESYPAEAQKSPLFKSKEKNKKFFYFYMLPKTYIYYILLSNLENNHYILILRYKNVSTRK